MISKQSMIMQVYTIFRFYHHQFGNGTVFRTISDKQTPSHLNSKYSPKPLEYNVGNVVQMEIKIFRKLVILSFLVRARRQNKVLNRVNLVRLLITVVQMEIKIFRKLVIVLILVRMRSQNKVLNQMIL